jgi:hypothetical protein
LSFENTRLRPVSPYVGTSTNRPQDSGRRNGEKPEFCPRPFFSILLEDGRPVLDEVVATGADVHLEQMDHDKWWMGIQSGGKDLALWFTLEDGRLCVRLSDQDDENAQWEGDNREKPMPGADG